jgi:peptide/nickel transport system substrate-binding protein
VLALGLLLGCRGAARPAHGGDGGTLRVQMEVEPPSLNPLVEHDAWTVWLTLGAIYDPLVRQDPTSGAFSPSLAVRWEQPDERTFRFLLRRGVTWHDGRPFGADDVVATFERLREPGVAAERRADFAEVASVEKRADDEVLVRLARPAPLLLQGLARLAILPAHRFGAGELRAQPASRAPVGTGPFRFVEWRAGERIVLARAPSYWGPRAHLERVELRIVGDREAVLELLRRGELDLVWQLAPSQLERLPEHARIVEWYLPRYSFVVWNNRRPGLGDRRVRQALTLLTDRARWRQVAFGGRAREVTGPFPPGSPSYDQAIAPWPFDPVRARTLLDQAGVVDRDGDGVRELPGGEPLRLAFLLNAGSPTLEPLATMMQEDFRRAGVALSVVPVDWATLLDRLRQHAFDAAALQWVMLPVQDDFSLFHSSQAEGGQNYGVFRDPETDQLLEAARRLPPGPERARIDRAIHRRIHEEQPYTFLASPPIDSAVAARVHGYAPGPDGLGLPGMSVDP